MRAHFVIIHQQRREGVETMVKDEIRKVYGGRGKKRTVIFKKSTPSPNPPALHFQRGEPRINQT